MPATSPILFTPGPVRIPRLVADALADPPCNYHRQSAFTAMFRETEGALKRLVGLRQPGEWFATVLTSTGTAGNEACLEALGATGKGVIVDNGFFSARLCEQVRQNGLPHVVLSAPGDRPIDPAAVDAFLTANPGLSWLYFVSHETRMGLKNPMAAIGQVAKKHGLLVGADIVSSAYAYPIDLEASGLDVAVTSSAKAIMGVPGLAIVFVRLASLPALAAAPRRGYYLDLVAETEKQRSQGQPRFAQPVALHAALHAACKNLERIGIDKHMARIQQQMRAVMDCLAGLGLHPQLRADYRSNIAVNFDLPAGLEYPAFGAAMEARGFYLLYGIPGDASHFQVSTIGDLDDAHVVGLTRALLEVLGPHPRAGDESSSRSRQVVDITLDHGGGFNQARPPRPETVRDA